MFFYLTKAIYVLNLTHFIYSHNVIDKKSKIVITSSVSKIMAEKDSNDDRKSELEAFDDSKTGVKGLVDSGAAKVPRIFIHEQNKLEHKSGSGNCQNFTIPIIDFQDIDRDASARCEIIDKVRKACEKWGFFQVVDHGIPLNILEEIINAVRKFHELDADVKKEFYSRDETRSMIYNTNFDFYQAPAANWRDSLYCVMAPPPPNPEELPAVCRYVIHTPSFMVSLVFMSSSCAACAA